MDIICSSSILVMFAPFLSPAVLLLQWVIVGSWEGEIEPDVRHWERVSGHLIGPHTLLHLKEVAFLDRTHIFMYYLGVYEFLGKACVTCHQIVPHTTRGGIFFRAESHFHIIFGLFTNSLCQLSPNCTSILACLCR